MRNRRRNTVRTAVSHRRSLWIERLEERRLLAVVTVDTLNDTVDLADGVTSLREAIFAANIVAGADAIEFAASLTAGGPATLMLTMGELVITDSLAIDGPGADLLTVDASGNDPTPDSTSSDGDSTNDGDGSRVFFISDGVIGTTANPELFDVMLSGLTIAGGDVNASGGGILSYENLIVDGCTVTQNTAYSPNVNGGGILAVYGSLTIESSTVGHNFASSNGGGVDFNTFNFAGSKLTVTNSQIINNRSNKWGGGLQIVGQAEIVDSTIVENRSVTGGGMHMQPSSNAVEILRTQITHNTAMNGGGIAATPFSNQFSVRLLESSVVDNTATGSGGGIYNTVPASLLFPNSAFEVIGTTVSGNQAVDGGGIYWGSNFQARVEGSTIAENRATRDGGGIWNWTSRVTVVKSSFKGNMASRNGGGALAVGSIVINGIAFVGNSAGGGGGLYAIQEGFTAQSVVIGDSAFIGNTATGEGGGIRASLPLTLERSIVNDNHAIGISSGRGGGISGAAVTIQSSVIAGNSTSGTQAHGGGIFASGTVSIEDSSIIGNSTSGSDSRGGGLSGGTTTIVSSTISGNWTNGANAHGGGIATGTSTIRHSTITDNHTMGGGARAGGADFIGTPDGFHHVILAGNTAAGGNPDLRFSIASQFRNSLIGDKAGTTLVEAQAPNGNGSLIGNSVGGGVIDPLLSPLANNGGPQFIDESKLSTHALLPSSPAINAGLASAVAGSGIVPLHDQRGEPFGRVAGGRIDIGAFESQVNPLQSDYNFNGVVDAADYSVWRDMVGSVNDLRADGSGDGLVDAADYGVWKANFGNVLGQGAGSLERGEEDGGGGGVAMEETRVSERRDYGVGEETRVSERRDHGVGDGNPHPLDSSRPLPGGEMRNGVIAGTRVSEIRDHRVPVRGGFAMRSDALLAWLAGSDGDGRSASDTPPRNMTTPSPFETVGSTEGVTGESLFSDVDEAFATLGTQ